MPKVIEKPEVTSLHVFFAQELPKELEIVTGWGGNYAIYVRSAFSPLIHGKKVAYTSWSELCIERDSSWYDTLIGLINKYEAESNSVVTVFSKKKI